MDKPTHEQKIGYLVDEITQRLWEELGENFVGGVGIGGSFARGKFSPSRPDINIILFVKEGSPKIYLEIAKIFDNLAQEYKDEFNLRPRSEPERSTSSFKRDPAKNDIFFKISFLQLSLKEDKNRPFGRPSSQVESLSKNLKMKYGKNYLTDLRTFCSNNQILEGIYFTLKNWKGVLRYTPSSYRKDEVDLFFNEVLAYGKLVVHQSAWLAGLVKGLDFSKEKDRKEILEAVFDKEKLRIFSSIFNDSQIIDKINLILDARLYYQEWKFDLKRTESLYQTVYTLIDDLLGVASNLNI